MAEVQERVQEREIAWSPAALERMYAQRDPLLEIAKCWSSPAYFVDQYVWIYNATERGWIKMRPWPAQLDVLHALDTHQYAIVLKARQLGMSWLTVAYALWLMLFRNAATVLLMSKREDEAVELLANRLMPMHQHLPRFMQARKVERAKTQEFVLSNGSRAMAFSTAGGRSYTGTMVLIDEADYVPDLNGVLNSLKPTVDAGGKLVLVSTPDKAQPISTFKQIYRGAQEGSNSYHPVFLPWQARPGRSEAWYEQVKRDMWAQEGSNDSLWQEYPATVEEALAPKQLDKRFALEWITRCYEAASPLVRHDGPPLPALAVYVRPQAGRGYCIGVDPAEGNPRSDDSVATVLDAETWEEVACLAGKIEPDALAQQTAQVAAWYNGASVLVERNNHGHAVLLALKKVGGVRLLEGHDAAKRVPGQAPAPDVHRKWGWLQSEKGKALMYDLLAETLRDGATRMRTQQTAQELATIEASTLSAPEGLHDDHAVSYALAVQACKLGGGRGELSEVIAAADPLTAYDETGWTGQRLGPGRNRWGNEGAGRDD